MMTLSVLGDRTFQSGRLYIFQHIQKLTQEAIKPITVITVAASVTFPRI